ncbi:MAG TPA: hypothetical protein VFG33_40300 [Kribbella sp.]|uniref:hypothetical protein n=1 Tax=Kribbella sp. TaxID=1871183 RepID=UPI002D7713B5|nr:hypothetical protein [Kribbella sp.]HET6299675.1 hypothetical protein [Kribbella sp.]
MPPKGFVGQAARVVRRLRRAGGSPGAGLGIPLAWRLVHPTPAQAVALAPDLDGVDH